MPEKKPHEEDFNKFAEDIRKLGPSTRGFKERAFPHFDELYKGFGLHDKEHRKKVIHQVMDRINSGESVHEAFHSVGVVPASFDEKKLREYDNFFRGCVSEQLERLSESEKGYTHYPKESHIEDVTAPNLVKEVLDFMGGEFSRNKDVMSRAAVSVACEGKEVKYETLRHYLNVPRLPDDVRTKVEKWLKTADFSK